MRFFRFTGSLLLMLLTLGAIVALTPSPASAQIGIGVGIRVGPPALPVYEQPPLPGLGYLWAPGYWAYGDAGYYWVPGTWALPPQPGFLWTPGYWGWNAGLFGWNGGYWGLHVGFYGGINYGFGYGGVGFFGGYWNNGAFFYNRAYNNFGGVHVTNIYNKTVINNNVSHAAYNGGPGGVTAKPTAEEERAASETHVPATAAQTEHARAASTNHALLASVNHGRPAIAATSKPGDFSHPVAAKTAGAPYKAPAAGTATGANRNMNNGSRMAGTTPRTPPPSRTNTSHPNEMNHNPSTAHPNEGRTEAPPRESAPHSQAAPHNEPRAAAPHNTPPHVAAPHNEPHAAAPHNTPPHATAPHNEPHAAPEEKGGGDPKRP